MSESVAGTVTSNASTIQTVATGRGGGRGQPGAARGSTATQSSGRGRNNRNNNRNRNRLNNGNIINTPRGSFKGNTADMNGHVFECYEERGDRTQFPKTLEALSEYAAKNLKFPEDLKSMFTESMTPPVIPDIADINETTATKKQLAIWESDLKSYSRRTEALRSNLTTIYAVIWGQCSEAMRNKLRALERFIAENTSNNCVWLLNEIKGVTHQFDTKCNIFVSLLDARKAFYNCKQSAQQTNAEYLSVFSANIQVLEYYKATVGENYTVVDDNCGTLTTVERTKIARDSSIAIAFIVASDHSRYGALLSDLANQQIRGNDQYPKDLTAAYSLLVNFHAPTTTPRSTQQQRPPSQEPDTTVPSTVPSNIGPHTFVQVSPDASTAAVAGRDGTLMSHIPCYTCHSNGHYSTNCPTNLTGVSLLQHAISLTQVQTGMEEHYDPIPSTWILLDSQSSISIFNNASMLTNIRDSPQHVLVQTNGGSQLSTQIGDFKNLGEVWYNPQSIANILSLSDVSRLRRVVLDTSAEMAFIVYKMDGTTMRFSKHEGGLFVHDVQAQSSPVTVPPLTLLQTVANNCVRFTKSEVAAADSARELYRKLGRPSQKKFEDTLANNIILNCPLTVDDAKRALLIYGPDLATIKGKTVTGSAASHVPNFIAVPIPAHILQDHQQVTLCMDFFYVQGQIFLHIISRVLQHRIVHPVKDRSLKNFIKHIINTLSLYRNRGFLVTDIHADNEFACIRDHVAPINLDIVAADSHVGEIERSIRTIKERCRATVHGLPYRRLPKLLVREIVRHSVTSLNQLPADDGISDIISPQLLLTGKPNPDYSKLKLELGSYVQIFEPTTFSMNTLRSRTTGAIVLNHTGNMQGDYQFMSLITGKCLSRHQWTLLPMPDSAIARVEEMAALEDQPWVQSTGMLVEWRPNQAFDDEFHDPDYVYTPDVDDDDDLSESWEDVTADDLTINIDNLSDAFSNNDDDSVVSSPSTDNIPPASQADNYSLIEEPDDYDTDADDDTEEDIDVMYQHHDHFLDPPSEPTSTLPVHGHNLRPPRDRSYDHRLDHQMDNAVSSTTYIAPTQLLQNTQTVITAFLFTQMSAAAGIKIYGQAAIDAVLKEFCQLHDKGVFLPHYANTLTHQQRRAALRAVNLIKEKRSGEVKGRTCADGSTQRHLYDKSETSSPTVANDALMYTVLVDAKEGRDVATADVVGAYLNAYMDTFTLFKLIGEAVTIMIQVDPMYADYVTYEHGKPVLYLQLIKALYGCVKSALLWYELFTGTLLEMGFILNPYDPCVANKHINGSQCTVVWYVDDNKISHIDPDVVTNIITQIEQRFGKMTVTRGKQHTFLGMSINFNNDHTVSISMTTYLQDSIRDSQMDISTTASTPAKKDLFDIDDTLPLLPKHEADIFHSVVARLLYVSLRGRPDIILAISFLCTRVSKSTLQDQLKLRRLLEYLNGTLDLILTLGADDLSHLRTWVDASYAVHPDMKSHTGGVISLGKGALICKSSKQKLNTKSSTEAELVGATDYLPNTIWSKNFLEAQGHQIINNYYEQDNVSAIQLEKNGRASAGKKSRHIDIRYFFMKDRLVSENIQVRHCPTQEMLADFLTKPLQGSLFRKFRDALLGYKHMDSLSIKSTSPSPEERVEKENSFNSRNSVSVPINSRMPVHTPVDKHKKVSLRTPVHIPVNKNKKGNSNPKDQYYEATEETGSWELVQKKKTKRQTTRSHSHSESGAGTCNHVTKLSNKNTIALQRS